MELTSTTLLVVVAVLAAAVPILAVILWRRSVRLRRASAGRTMARWLLLVAGQLLAVALTFLVVNNQYAFYTSWSDLFGASTSSARVSSQGR